MAAFYDFLRILFIFKIVCMDLYWCELLDVRLVFELQDVFESDLTLITKDTNRNGDSLIRKFYKQEKNKHRGFIGAVNIKEDLLKMERKLFDSFDNVMVILDAKTNPIEALIQVQNLNLMAAFIWIYFFEDGLTEKLNDLYIPYNSRFYLINKRGDFVNEIEDVYQISENSEKIYTPFGLWKNGVLEIFQSDYYGKRMNLRGHQFNIAEAHFKDNKETAEKLWTFFTKPMNCSINWQKRGFGELFPNGTAIGVFQDIIEKKIDGTPAHNLYLKGRTYVFDYIFPASILQAKFFLELDSEFSWESYLAPFHVFVYASIFIWIIISTIIINFIIKSKCRSTSETSTFMVIRALLFQSGTATTSDVSFYISYLMPYILSVILTQYYSAALSSYVAVKQADMPFKNLQGIINDGSYRIIVFRKSYSYLYFLTDPGPETTAVREKNLLVEYDKLPDTNQAGLDSICENRWVFLNYVTSIVVKPKCQIAEVEKPFFVYSTGAIVWKGFPYKNIMTKILKRLQFGGLTELWYKSSKWKYEKSELFEPFSLELVYPIFMLYLAVITLSVLILLCELLWRKCSKNVVKGSLPKEILSANRMFRRSRVEMLLHAVTVQLPPILEMEN